MDRAVFELHFVEGFEPDEVAMITGQSLPETRQTIARLQERLRQALLAEAAL
jgi:DNA-directed RNA polymerase specialized sigma24 family protein